MKSQSLYSGKNKKTFQNAICCKFYPARNEVKNKLVNFQVYIAMEHAGHGDLLEYIKLRGAIPEEKAKVMFRQMADAIDYLHKNSMVHRYHHENIPI